MVLLPSRSEIKTSLSSHGEFAVQGHLKPQSSGASFKMFYLRYSMLA